MNHYALVTQLVEYLTCNEVVIGSNPVGGSCPACAGIVNRQAVYCSNHCQKVWQRDQYIIRWFNDLETGLTKAGLVSVSIKEFYRYVHNNKCQLCGWAEINIHTNIVPLEMNHIDGNHLNNRPSNLELICPNCHALTSNYRGRNKGRGRANRS